MDHAADYGDHNASIYDRIYPRIEPGLLDCLQSLAGAGPALELGVGTGRVAVPLAARGVDIHGIDASQSMIGVLTERPGGVAIPVRLADFCTAPLGGPYRLVYSLVSTLRLLPSADNLRQCFANVAAHLLPDGLLLVEDHDPESVSPEPVTIEVPIEADAGHQTYRVRVLSISRSAVDSLAAEAGLVLMARWQDWRKTPLPVQSVGPQRHVSLYRKMSSRD
ncbi:MAG: class I SAM-dependent methyltransferase [Ahniella sp.]|nr:class I SAM-dependent methyltransferase [Ahniella sp.]